MNWRREWQDVRWTFLGYPPGHRWHEANPLLRYYPLAVTSLVVGLLARACA
jgi:hypothetical protein